MKVFAGNANPKLAQDICRCLGMALGQAEVGRFPDGETKVRILEDIRGRDVFIIQPTCPPVNDNLMELLILIDACRRASAERITAVIPYFGYARQDRKHEGRVPITAKLVANLLATAGVSRVLCMDLHSSQIQGFFDIPVDHLYAGPVMSQHLRRQNLADPVIMCPDTGGIKMANGFAKRLGAGLALMHKRRTGDSEVERAHIVGDIAGKDVVIVDDMISTAGTIVEAVRGCLEMKCRSISVLATHPVFCGRAYERLSGLPVREIAVCDTIPLKKMPENVKVAVLSVAPLLAEAIRRTHRNESVSKLFD
ncbi:MAG: ribose-phosphate pyrophosphokinase [Planctomycetota bacterium]|nr:ribose-phosphate pyrophosphokinase [Planctomycetota bacterium]